MDPPLQPQPLCPATQPRPNSERPRRPHRPGCLPLGRADSRSPCHPSTQGDVSQQHPFVLRGSSSGALRPGLDPGAAISKSGASVWGFRDPPPLHFRICSDKWSLSQAPGDCIRSGQEYVPPSDRPWPQTCCPASIPQHGRSLLCRGEKALGTGAVSLSLCVTSHTLLNFSVLRREMA